MANSGKVSKGLTYKTKSKVIFGIVIAVLILTVGGYFVYISGILPRLIPAVKLTRTVDGKTQDIGSANVNELNYYRNTILSMYQMYGMTVNQEYLDTVDEATGKTNSQMIYDTAAEQILNNRLMLEKAEADQNFVSGADRIGKNELDQLRSRAKSYGESATLSWFLTANYGTGMSASEFMEIKEREAKADEYQEYLKQFVTLPSDEEVQKVYDDDPSQFDHATYNSQFFANENYPNGVAKKNAEAVKAATEDSDSFNQAVLEALGPDTDFDINKNPTFHDDGDRRSVTTTLYPEEMVNFIFDKNNVGKTEVFESENGYFVVYLKSSDDMLGMSYSYRELVIRNETISEPDVTAEKIASDCDKVQKEAEDIKAKLTGDETDFVNNVKKYTEVYEDIRTGGYKSGVTSESFEEGEGKLVTEDDKQLGAWLQDPSRKHGDMILIRAANNSRVTIFFFDDAVPAWKNKVITDQTNTKFNEWMEANIDSKNAVPMVSYSVAEHLTYFAADIQSR